MARSYSTGVLIPAVLMLSGCAAIGQFTQKHPVVTAVGVAVVMGSFAASQQHGGHAIPHCHERPLPLDCRPIM